MEMVRQLMRAYGITNRVEVSERKDKKLKALVDGRWIHFGHPDYEDFTTHRDKKRRANYCARAGGIRDKRGRLTGNDPSSPIFYAMRLLWDCKPK